MTGKPEIRRPTAALLLLFLIGTARSEAVPTPAPECRALHVVEATYAGPARYAHGLLWKISKPGTRPSYLFGTIHLADEAVVDLPPVVSEKLAGSRLFVMEALPQTEQAAKLSQMMFFSDQHRLDNFLSASMFKRVVAILGAYHLEQETVNRLKPWAAFVTMSYPADLRPILDLQLLNTAKEKGLDTRGLETLEEEGEIFNRMELQDQLTLLKDASCYHDRFLKDFEVMKSLYLKRDLKGLFLYSQRYSFDDNSVYDSLTGRLLTRRNRTMTDRMQPILREGGAFIAIGALHLTGNDGVLDLLNKKNYRITRVY